MTTTTTGVAISGVSVRFATVDDVDDIFSALAEIAEIVGERHKFSSTPEDLRRFGFGEAPAFQVLVAEVDGRFAGCCVYFPSFSTWAGKPGVYIQDFYIADLFRGQGIGEKLLARLAAVTRERGGCYIRLSVDTKNLRAQAFYERAGIRRSDKEQIHAAYGAEFDALADADPGGQRTE